MNAPKQTIVHSSIQKAEHLLGPAFAAMVEPHSRRYANDLAALETAHAAEQRRKVRQLVRRILRSYSAKLVCLVRSTKKTERRTVEWFEQAASDLRVWEDCGEPVNARAEPKSSGDGFRVICKFGPKRTALQTLCADMLEALFGVDPTNYLAKGRGPDRAADHLTRLIEESGYRFFVLADIKDFFPSVQLEALASIFDLPKVMIERCAHIGTNVPLRPHPIPSNTIDHRALDRAARRGLPQGSRASGVIAGLLLGRALRQIASADRVMSYGDDIAIAARSESEANALRKALT